MPGIPQLNASDVPTQQSSGIPVDLRSSCLYIVFGTWLIKPGSTTFPFPSDALEKVFLVHWLVDFFFFSSICISSEFSSRSAISLRVSGPEKGENI